MTTPVAPPQYYALDEDQIKQVNKIEEILKVTRFSNRTNKNNYKKSTGYGQSEAFGFIRRRNRCPGPCRNNERYPLLWKELQALGSTLQMQYDAVQVNFNCTCNAHRDEGNEGLSMLLSGGDYTGGELVTEFGTFSAKYRCVLFDGSKITHSNNPFVGNKWSLVFFSIQIPPHKQHYYPDGFRTTYPYYRSRFLETIPHKETLYFPNGITKHKGTPQEKHIAFS